MNQKNRDALMGILLLAFEGATWESGEEFNADDALHFAEELTRRGVLAVEALTEQDLLDLAEIGDASMPDRAALAIKALLVGIAKGET